jgi:hypothetical protein
MSGQYNKIVPVDSSLLSSKSNNETKRPTEWVIEEDFLIFKLRESTPFHDSTGTPHLYSDIGFVRKYKCNNQNKFNVIRGLWFCCNLRGIEYATFYIFSNPNFREPPSPPLSLE